MILFFILTLGIALLLTYVLKKFIFEAKWEYVIYFLLLYLPIYITLLSISYKATGAVLWVQFFQIAKEFVVISALISFLVYHKNLWEKVWRLNTVDKLFLLFMLLASLYLFLPIGAPFLSKLLYYKSMLIPAIVYFLGRNSCLEDFEVKRVFQMIFLIVIAAFLVNLIEKTLDVHLQTLIGYADYNLNINNIEPSGNFDLTWTFETQAITKRLASFYADPLELASSVLLGFSAALIWYLTSKKNLSLIYICLMLMSLASLFFSASRAAFAAFFVMIFFVAIIFKLRKLIFSGLAILLLFLVYVGFFASEDFYYFVIDTLTFENTSSVGHVIEWVLSLESMVNNPLGLGLAMSGNFGSVTDELRVGGENQFLIFGVQLGWLGMFLYVLLLFYSIYYSIKTFYLTSNTMDARVAFVAGTVKFGLLIPLFTANVEIYTYVSWVTWWMVGYSINNYQQIKFRTAHDTL